MRFRAATLAAVTTAAMLSCGRSADSSFERECASVKARLSAAGRPVNAGSTRQVGYATEQSWELEVGGNKAKESLGADVPADYKLTRDGEGEISYVKYDQHDSFYLTLTFRKSANPSSTYVVVLLKATPD